jgi:integrase
MLYATTGLRRNEVLGLRLRDLDLKRRLILPGGSSRTKRRWATCFNREAEQALRAYLSERPDLGPDSKLFPAKSEAARVFNRASKASGVKITPQVLREWFACELARLGVPDRYVDAFCGRVPRSVLARHYTDYSPERLREIYERAGLRVLG